MACFPDPEIERILTMPDEQMLDEVRAEGRDPERVAAEMLALFDEVALFALVEDVNGHSRPRWEELLERKVETGLVGEALSLVRWLLTLKERRVEKTCQL